MQRTEFLREKGFDQDPFAPRRAREEREKELLSSIFLMVNGFDGFIGDPAMPQTHILCAPRGHGKTSHLLQVKKSVATRSARPLVVELTDFNLVLKDGLSQVNIYRYMTIITKLVLEEINVQLQSSPECLDKLENSPSFQPFCTWLSCYSEETAWNSGRRARQQDILAHKQEANSYGPEMWLTKLANFAKDAGFASIYVLIDGVDETEHTTQENDDSRKTMSKMLLPLLATQRLMHGCGFAFKFFIPKYLYSYMQTYNLCRLDCYPVFELAWTPEDIVKILNMRLSYYSMGGINSFLMLCDELCEDVFHQLITVAGFPYRLIEWLDHIINQHCSNVSDVDEAIRCETIQTVLQEVYCPSISDITLTYSPLHNLDFDYTLGTPFTFQATVSFPASTTALPMTYTWYVDGKEEANKASTTLVDTFAWTWDTPGEKTVAVRVRNAAGSQTQSLSLTVTVAHDVLWCDDQGTFFISNQQIALQPTGYLYKLLKALYTRIEQPVSLEELVKTVYVGRKFLPGDARTIQKHKCRLSDILETEYRFIEAYRGGYRLVRQGKPVTKKRNPA